MNHVDLEKTPGSKWGHISGHTPLPLLGCSPRQGNGGHLQSALSPGDPKSPSADATAGLCTPARDPGPSLAREAESAALRGERQVSPTLFRLPAGEGQPNPQAPPQPPLSASHLQTVPAVSLRLRPRPPHRYAHCCAGAVPDVAVAQSPGVVGVAGRG